MTTGQGDVVTGSVIEARARFPATGLGARSARRFASELVGAPVADDVALVVSELAANAVLHAGTPFDLVVRDDGRRLRVEVSDGSPVLPSPGARQPEGISGRGLLIVERLTSAWGARRTEHGKVVWAELRSPGHPPAIGF